MEAVPKKRTRKEIEDAKKLVKDKLARLQQEAATKKKAAETATQVIETEGDKTKVQELKEKLATLEKERDALAIVEESKKDEKDAEAEKKITAVKASAHEAYKVQEEAELAKAVHIKLGDVGLTEDDFADIASWQTLSAGQKLLTINQISQNVLLHVKEIGERRFREKNRITKKFNPFSFTKKVFRNVFKSVWISKEEKDVLAEAEAGLLKPDPEQIASLVTRAAEMELPVHIINNGTEYKAEIEFAETPAGLSPEEEKTITEYNRVANAYAEMPDAWRNEKAAKALDSGFSKKKNYLAYQQAQHVYEKQRIAFLALRAKYIEAGLTVPEKEKRAEEIALQSTKDIELQIAMLQFTNTNPNFSKEIEKIRVQSSWGRVFNNENIWKGIYSGTGFLARKAATVGLGIASGPMVASVIGAVRSEQKAEGKIRNAFNEGRTEETRLERKAAGKSGSFEDKNANLGIKGNLAKLASGYDVNAKEIAGFVDADSQIIRLEALLEKLDKATEKEVEFTLQSSLAARIEYIEQKHQEGLINYGSKENAIDNNYKLLKKLTEARVRQIDLNDAINYENIKRGLFSTRLDHYLNDEKKIDGTPLYTAVEATKKAEKDIEIFDMRYQGSDSKISKNRDEFLEALMKHNENKLDTKQNVYLLKEFSRGVVMGGTFSLIGLKIHDWVYGAPQTNLPVHHDQHSHTLVEHRHTTAKTVAAGTTFTAADKKMIDSLGMDKIKQPWEAQTQLGPYDPNTISTVQKSIQDTVRPIPTNSFVLANAAKGDIHNTIKPINTFTQPAHTTAPKVDTKAALVTKTNTVTSEAVKQNPQAQQNPEAKVPVTKTVGETKTVTTETPKKPAAPEVQSKNVQGTTVPKAKTESVPPKNETQTPKTVVEKKAPAQTTENKKVVGETKNEVPKKPLVKSKTSENTKTTKPPEKPIDTKHIEKQKIDDDPDTQKVQPSGDGSTDLEDKRGAGSPVVDESEKPNIQDYRYTANAFTEPTIENPEVISGQYIVNGNNIPVGDVNEYQPPILGDDSGIEFAPSAVAPSAPKIAEGFTSIVQNQEAAPVINAAYKINTEDIPSYQRVPHTVVDATIRGNNPSTATAERYVPKAVVEDPILKPKSPEAFDTLPDDAKQIPDYEYTVDDRKIGGVTTMVKTPTTTYREERDPISFRSAHEVRKTFRDTNREVIIEKPENPTVDGTITYKRWNTAASDLFDQHHIQFGSRADYERENVMQQLFGHAEQKLNYVEKLKKDVASITMHYFRAEKSWATIKDIPAKYFLGKTGTLDDLSHLSTDQLSLLKEAGIVNNANEFIRQSELLKITKAYAKYVKNTGESATPKDGETILSYITRITRDLHQNQDGTFFYLKNTGQVSADSRVWRSVRKFGA